MKKRIRILTVERLKELVHYNPDTGDFTRNGNHYGRGTSGSLVGSYKDKDGYLVICVDYKEYGAHQLAFLYMTGKFSSKLVDHKDKIKSNNKWNNLTEVDYVLNAQNAKIRTDNISGITGVSLGYGDSWIAQIAYKGKKIYLGTWTDFVDAVCARFTSEQCLKWYTGSGVSKAHEYMNDNVFTKENTYVV